MLVYIVVGSVREGRTTIKIANWLETAIPSFNLKDFQTEVIDLKEWNLPLFSGSHPPATGIYDQPKQQEWANKIAQADAFIFISPEYNHGYSPALKMHSTMLVRNGVVNQPHLLAMAPQMALALLAKYAKSPQV